MRDTRVAATVPGPSTCNLATDFWTAAWQVDLLFSNRWGSAFGTTCSANGKYNYWYDRDGRRTSTWDEYDKYHVTTSFVSSQASGGTGLESVYQTAVVAASNYLSDSFGGGTYSYFYDSLGRRRAKTTPWSSTDEYFYDLGHQMLSDRGANAIGGSSTTFPEDDYIWLGGRPVLLVRGQMSASTWARQAETTSTWCQRNGEYLVCGERPIVTDYLGKPVLMLDRGGTAYTATYEAFGYANRHEYRVGSPHYVVGSSNVATIAPPVQSGFDATLRFLTSRSNFSIFSSVTVNGQTEAALQGDRSHTWTTWRTNGSSTWTIAWNGSSPDYGFDVEAYELKVKQIGTVWASTPLRFPGQYFDAETELHENFNRYFDPSSGRYLSPEPMLQDPGFALSRARSGIASPTYAYASNNPIAFVDVDGLHDTNGCQHGSTCSACDQQADKITDGELRLCVRKQCRAQDVKLKCDQEAKKGCADLAKNPKNTKGKPGHGKGGSAFVGTPDAPEKEVDWCELPVDAACQAKQLVHELAHTCGWKHESIVGVPGEGTGQIPSCGKMLR